MKGPQLSQRCNGCPLKQGNHIILIATSSRCKFWEFQSLDRVVTRNITKPSYLRRQQNGLHDGATLDVIIWKLGTERGTPYSTRLPQEKNLTNVSNISRWDDNNIPSAMEMWPAEKSGVFDAGETILMFLLRLEKRVNFTGWPGIRISSSLLSSVKSITTCCGVTATKLDGLGALPTANIDGSIWQLDLALFAFNATPRKKRKVN